MAKESKSNKIFVKVFLFLLIFVINEVFSVFYPTNILRDYFRRGHYSNRGDHQKMCFASQRVLSGAIQMHDMDTIPFGSMKDLTYEELEKTLLNGHYLKEPVKLAKPDCDYKVLLLDGECYVYCVLHGGVEHDINNKIPGPSEEFLNNTPEAISNRNLIYSAFTYIALIAIIAVI